MTETFKRIDSGIIVPFDVFTKVINTSDFEITFTASSAVLKKRTLEDEISVAYEISKNSNSSDFVNL